MTRPGTTIAAVAVAAGLVGGAGMAAAAPAEADSAQRGGLSRFYDQRLDWGECGTAELDAAGARCANVTVPLDYQQPRGRTITVAISRLTATDPTKRRGIMLSNPGGPGNPGLDQMLLVRPTMSAEVTGQYDLIGMDPRGIGRSSPVDCGWSTGITLRAAGPDRQSFDQNYRAQAELAVRCAVREGDRLRHITTRNTARDMDVVRGALGERQISYFSWSYGTYLGAVYTQMFPQRTDRFVLDSAIDPARYGRGLFQDAGRANEAALDRWAAWAARHDAEYHLGTTAGQVRAQVEALIRGASEKPIRIGGHAVDATLLPVMYFIFLDRPDRYAPTAAATRNLLDAAAGRQVVVDPLVEGSLLALTSGRASPDADGQLAVTCGDVAYPGNPETYWNDIRRNRAAEPVYASMLRNVTPCAFWDSPKEKATVVGNDRPALIVQATGDTRTPYEHGVGLHQALTGSRLVTLEDVPAHAIFGLYPNKCVEGHVNTYLATGELPSGDVTCRD
ncbi:alpha/beta fold hydrolase [Actinosynnema sp. NPDC023587]|uniref:alpha/beta hydrolase n=1 Tax=Actinosynnema sp. NPDC023587 TaxID=3154695 RepID=UPI0033DDF471